MSYDTSVSLIRRVKDRGDQESWREFSVLYERIIRQWLKRQGVHDNDTDDVVQDVMTYVMQEIPKFEHSGRAGALRNWLRRVTAFRLQQFWRARKRAARDGVNLGDLADQLAVEQSGVSRIFQQEHDQHVLKFLLSQVSRQFQESSLRAFEAVVLEQRPAQDVAESLNMTLGAVRVAQSRVLKAIRDLGEGLIE